MSKSLSSSDKGSPPRPRAAVTPGGRYGRDGIPHLDHRVVHRITSRGPFDDYLNFKTSSPGRLEHLSEEESGDQARGIVGMGSYDRFPAFEGPEELERQFSK